MSQRILIVDDHDGIRRRLRFLLEGAGFQVSGEAINGKEAVEKSKELKPDLVLLDLSMPVMTGLEALPHIAKLNRTKILVLAVEESDEVKQEALRLGAHGYIGKSNLPDHLVAEVQRLLPSVNDGVLIIELRQPGRISLAPKNLLFVDDEESIRITLAPILKKHGFDVTAAASVVDALAQMDRAKYEVLVSDLNIEKPGDGLAVIAAMKIIQPTCANIILTAYPDFDTAQQAIRLSVADYFVKPVNVEELISTIAKAGSHESRPANIL